MISEISIIIPTLNEEYYLPKTLESITRQNYFGKLEVIVVDCYSSDKTVKFAKKFKDKIKDFKIIYSPKGVNIARNRGANVAKYKYFLFLDSDILLTDNFLNKFCKKLNPEENFIDFTLHLPLKPNFLDYMWIAIMYTFLSILQFFDPIISGSFIFTTKVNHKKVKGFGEKIALGGDVDYGRKSVSNGAKYHLHFTPYVLASPRRLREVGRFKLLFFYVISYFHILKNGPMYDNNLFAYPFGEHKKNL